MFPFSQHLMINEHLIHKRLMQKPLGELRERSAQLEAKRRHYGKGRLPHSLSMYRRRLMRALGLREAEQQSQKMRSVRAASRPMNVRLGPQQRYDNGYAQGRQDALNGRSSAQWDIEDFSERDGYIDGYCTVLEAQSRQTGGLW